MTRERLLKVARRKGADVQQKVYDKLCGMLKKQSETPRNSSETPQRDKKTRIAMLLRRSVKLKG